MTTSVVTTPPRSTSSGTLKPTGGRSGRPRSDRRRARTVTSSPRRRRAPSAACVAMTSRNMTSASGSDTATTAVLVAPMSTPTAIRPVVARLIFDCLLFLRRARVVVHQGDGGVKRIGEIERADLAGNPHRSAVVRPRQIRGAQHIDNLDVMVEVGGGGGLSRQNPHPSAAADGPRAGWPPGAEPPGACPGRG